MEFTKIDNHPLRHGVFMLFAPGTILPPYFGMKKECEQMRMVWERKIKDEFNKLALERRKEVLEQIKANEHEKE